MCQGLNSHYFHIIGDGHQPNSRGLYTHYKDSYWKVGGLPSPTKTRLLTMAHMLAAIQMAASFTSSKKFASRMPKAVSHHCRASLLRIFLEKGIVPTARTATCRFCFSRNGGLLRQFHWWNDEVGPYPFINGHVYTHIYIYTHMYVYVYIVSCMKYNKILFDVLLDQTILLY